MPRAERDVGAQVGKVFAGAIEVRRRQTRDVEEGSDGKLGRDAREDQGQRVDESILR